VSDRVHVPLETEQHALFEEQRVRERNKLPLVSASALFFKLGGRH
jgi:hypothetical protein